MPVLFFIIPFRFIHKLIRETKRPYCTAPIFENYIISKKNGAAHPIIGILIFYRNCVIYNIRILTQAVSFITESRSVVRIRSNRNGINFIQHFLDSNLLQLKRGCFRRISAMDIVFSHPFSYTTIIAEPFTKSAAK